MNTTLLLNKASQEVERVKIQVAVDAKAAQLAHELARAAKVNLKQARKLSKMARKSARKTEDRAEESLAMLETARAKLEMLRERIRNERRKNDPAQPVRGSEPVPKSSPKPKLAVPRANGARRSAQKTVNGKTAKPVPVTRQKLGDLNPLPAPDVAAPSFSGQVPTDD